MNCAQKSVKLLFLGINSQRGKKMTMKKGTYYVGDLCYVMHEPNLWDRVIDLLYPPNAPLQYTSEGIPYIGKHLEGEFELDGAKFAIFTTSYGDGSYLDNYDRIYGVDSGTLGCILITDIAKDDLENIEFGNQIEFENDFEVKSENGIIIFGDVRINTGEMVFCEEENK